jgi:hypothetical protein
MPACLPPVDKSRRLRAAICCISHPGGPARFIARAQLYRARGWGVGGEGDFNLRGATSILRPAWLGSVPAPLSRGRRLRRLRMNARSRRKSEMPTHNRSAMEERTRISIGTVCPTNLDVQRPTRFVVINDERPRQSNLRRRVVACARARVCRIRCCFFFSRVVQRAQVI